MFKINIDGETNQIEEKFEPLSSKGQLWKISNKDFGNGFYQFNYEHNHFQKLWNKGQLRNKWYVSSSLTSPTKDNKNLQLYLAWIILS